MSQSNEGYKILNMEKEELKTMFEIGMAEEEWTYSLDIIDPYYNIDPKGYFKGVIGNKIVSIILAVRYPGNFGHIGDYLVVKEYRKKGYGLALFKKALEHLEGCTIGLVSVPEQVKNYQKMGFSISENVNFFSGKPSHCEVDFNVIPYDEKKHFDDIASYDKNCFPGDRSDFLKRWLKKPKTFSFVYYDKSDNKLKGYASIYQDLTEWSISPCCCDSKEIAKSLIAALVNQIGENDKFQFSTTVANQAAVDLFNEIADTYKLDLEATYPKMYKNGPPKNLDTQKCFCYVSIAIG